MIDDKGTNGLPETAKDAGTPGRNLGDLSAFKGTNGASGASRGGGPTSGGKPKKKIGRPTKNASGFSRETIEEVVDDPEIEAAREEFEECLVALLVSTTDNIADARFELLKTKFPEAVARGLADKARLTDKEKAYFGGVAVRIWRKYLGDKYLFTDEGILGVYALQYFLRNWEPMSQAKKIEAEINAKSTPKRDAEQPGLQGKVSPDSGREAHGKVDSGQSTNSLSPGPARSGL